MGLPQLSSSGGAAGAANALRRVLGVLWLTDALVKILIPFGGRAADQAYGQIMTVMAGTPGLHRPLAWETRLFLAHPFLWWLPAAVELCIGLWLVTRPASRPALAASAAWAVIVWVAAEGMGGLFSASSMLTGYPGAALLYAVAAAVLFPRRRPRQEEPAAAADAGLPGRYWSRVAWLALWLGAAFVTALPQNGPMPWPPCFSSTSTRRRGLCGPWTPQRSAGSPSATRPCSGSPRPWRAWPSGLWSSWERGPGFSSR